MVWHAHLLNPRDFLEDCLRHGRTPFWNTGLPLGLIVSCIDNETFEYQPGSMAATRFLAATGYSWNSLEDSQQLLLQCPKCSHEQSVPWTTLDQPDFWRAHSRETGRGFADTRFVMACASCQATTNHDDFSAHQFRLDCRALLRSQIPMPGTLLNIRGTLIQCLFDLIERELLKISMVL